MKFYALQEIGTIKLLLISKTQGLLKKDIERAYWNWKGQQKAGKTTTIDEWLTNKQAVEVTFTPLEIDENAKVD